MSSVPDTASGIGKVRENRVRRAAERQGLRLVKCKRRDPRALGFGTFGLVDTAGTVVAGDEHGYGLTLNDIEHRLGADA